MTLSGHVAILIDLLVRRDEARQRGTTDEVAELEGGLLDQLSHLHDIGGLDHVRDLLAQEEAVIRYQLMMGRTQL